MDEKFRFSTAGMQQSELFFYEDNPRIYSIVHSGTDRPSQAEIERRLSDMDHVKRLIRGYTGKRRFDRPTDRTTRSQHRS